MKTTEIKEKIREIIFRTISENKEEINDVDLFDTEALLPCYFDVVSNESTKLIIEILKSEINGLKYEYGSKSYGTFEDGAQCGFNIAKENVKAALSE